MSAIRLRGAFELRRTELAGEEKKPRGLFDLDRCLQRRRERGSGGDSAVLGRGVTPCFFHRLT